jgi:hypothetical protein
VLKVALALVLVFGTGSCEGPGAAAQVDAATLCSNGGLAAAQPMGGTFVAGAFGSTAAQTIAWASSGRSHIVTAPLAKAATDSIVAFCYVDGAFDGVPQPPGANITYDRALFLVPASGPPILYEVGRKSTIPILGPDQAKP